MKALIIAAGKGSRLQTKSKEKPKPLIRLLGLSLIERIILTAKQAGIEEFVVVVGYLGEKIKKELGNGKNLGVNITYIENNEWDRENGISVLMAKEVLKEKFVLLMSDHVFDSQILKRLQKTELKKDECVLVVDRAPDKYYIDLEDATKVKVDDDGYILEIGKDTENFNCVDCGIFLLSPLIFSALDQSVKEGDETLSGGIRILAKKRKIKSLEVGNNFWIDIDTIKSYRMAEKILCQKLKKPTDGPISKYLNRPVSIRISKFLVNFNLKPDLISLVSFFLCGLSGLFFSLGGYLYFVIAGVLSQLSSIIDGCDGEIARLKFQSSKYGAWFDAVLDRYADALIIFGMTYGWWKLHLTTDIWLVGFMALIGSFMNSYTAIKYDSIFLTREKSKIKVRIGRDIRIFLIMIGAFLNQIYFVLLLLGVLTNLESLRRLYILRKNNISEA